MRYVLSTLAGLALAVLILTPAAVSAGDGPVVWAQTERDEIDGLNWPDGADVTLMVDDPSNGAGVDYQDTATAELTPDLDVQTIVGFELGGVFDVQPGHEVTLTDGVTTKMVTVTGLAVTDVDTEADTVSGTAAPGSDVQIDVWTTNFFVVGATRHEVADAGGNWTTDFASPGDEMGEEDTFDILAGSLGTPGGYGPVSQEDAEGDRTVLFWSTGGDGGDEEPVIGVRPLDDMIEGYGWPLGADVTMTISGAGTASLEYSDVGTVGEAAFDPQQTYVEFQLRGTFDVVNGQTVAMTDGTTTKTLVVKEPVVTAIDIVGDTISGTATPGADVFVGIDMPSMGGLGGRHEVADASGNWTTDFSMQGDEGGEDQVVDIAFGQNLQANVDESDEDGDFTVIFQRLVPYPGDLNCDVSVNPIDSLLVLRSDAGLPVNLPDGCLPIGSYATARGPGDGEAFTIGGWTALFEPAGDSDGPVMWAQPENDTLLGFDWPDGADVSVQVDHPANGAGADYEQTTAADSSGAVLFNADRSFDLIAGDEITMTDGVTTKTHTITEVTTMYADEMGDTASGTAEPGSEVQVEVWGGFFEPIATRFEVADGSGNWTADFSIPGADTGEGETHDIVFGDLGPAIQFDDDGDFTISFWYATGGLQPFIGAVPRDDRIEGYGWPLSAGVTMMISESAGGPAVYTEVSSVGQAPFDSQQTYVEFQLGGTVDVANGQVVTMTDGHTTKTLTVMEPTITVIDVGSDTVSGTAAPGASLSIDINTESMGGLGHRAEGADASGNWTADFSTPGNDEGEDQTVDLAFGQDMQVAANQADEDGDFTVTFQSVVPLPGDVNCDGEANPIDSLLILRFDAGLSVNLPAGCPMIGTY